MTRWWLVVTMCACGGAAKPSPTPPPASPAPVAAAAPAPTCREAIEVSAARIKFEGELESSIAMCERQQWSADVRTCFYKATVPPEFGQCYKMLPTAATDEVDAITTRSHEAMLKVEYHADQVCACKTLDCTADAIDAAVKWVKTLAPGTFIKPDQPRSDAARDRMTGCVEAIKRKYGK